VRPAAGHPTGFWRQHKRTLRYVRTNDPSTCFRSLCSHEQAQGRENDQTHSLSLAVRDSLRFACSFRHLINNPYDFTHLPNPFRFYTSLYAPRSTPFSLGPRDATASRAVTRAWP
jgi:hypothetical protein